MAVNFNGNFNVWEALTEVSTQLSNASTENCLVNEQNVQFTALVSNNVMTQETTVLSQLYASENAIYNNGGYTTYNSKNQPHFNSMQSTTCQDKLNSLTSGYNTDTQWFTNLNSEYSGSLQGTETQMSIAMNNNKSVAELFQVVTTVMSTVSNAIGNN